MLPDLKDIEVERIHSSAYGNRKGDKRKLSVDMNPMVDLAFLLLTFFMLATTFIKPQAMQLLVPAKPKLTDLEQETPVKESKTLNLVLLEKNITWYKGITEPEASVIAYDDAELLQLLSGALRDTEGLVVLVKPLEESTYGQLVMVLDILAVTGAERYALAVPSPYDLSLANETK